MRRHASRLQVAMTDKQTMEEQPKLFTREELKARCSRNDAVLIIHNGVYDVSSFLAEVSRTLYITSVVTMQVRTKYIGDALQLIYLFKTCMLLLFLNS